MIERVLPFQFIKKSPLYGSYQGMNYRVTEMKGQLEVCTFPGTLCLLAYSGRKENLSVF